MGINFVKWTAAILIPVKIVVSALWTMILLEGISVAVDRATKEPIVRKTIMNVLMVSVYGI